MDRSKAPLRRENGSLFTDLVMQRRSRLQLGVFWSVAQDISSTRTGVHNKLSFIIADNKAHVQCAHRPERAGILPARHAVGDLWRAP